MKQSKGRVVFTDAEMNEIRELVADTKADDRNAQNALREKLRGMGFRIQELVGERGSAGFTVADLDELIRSKKIKVLEL